MQPPRYIKNIDAAIAAIIGFYLIHLYTSYSGIGISPDSIMYTSAARSFNAVGSFITFTNKPIVDFPVFYPFFLGSILFITKVDPITAGPVINGVLFAAVIYLSGWIMDRFINPSRIYKWLVLVAIVLSPALLQVYMYLWSETLFILLSLVFIIAYKQYLVKHNLNILLIAALIAGISTITRYAGITIIGTGGLLLLFDRYLIQKKKILHILLYGVTACSLLVLNLLRNALLTPTATGPREASLTPFGKNMYYFGTVICGWLNIKEQYYWLAPTFAWIILIALTLFFICRLFKCKNNSYEHIALTFALIYGWFIIISSTLTRYEQINSRLLAPMFIPLLWSCTVWIVNAINKVRNYTQRVIAWSAFTLIMLVFAGNELYADINRYNDQSYYGIPGYTDDSWNRSAFIALLKHHKHLFKPGIPIYSDAPEGVYFASGLPANLLPHSYFPADVDKFYKIKHYYLVWFNDLYDNELIGLNDIFKRKKMVKLYQYPDGAVYEYKSEP